MKNFLLILCSDGMRPFFIIGWAFELISLGLLAYATLLLFRSYPPKETLRRYTWDVNLRLVLPFTKRWQKEVAPEHIETIRKYRRGLFTWELVFFAANIFRIVYLDLLGSRLFIMLATGQCRN